MTPQEYADSIICKGDTLRIEHAGKIIVVDRHVGSHFLYTNEDGSLDSIREDLVVRVARGPNRATIGSGYYTPAR